MARWIRQFCETDSVLQQPEDRSICIFSKGDVSHNIVNANCAVQPVHEYEWHNIPILHNSGLDFRLSVSTKYTTWKNVMGCTKR